MLNYDDTAPYIWAAYAFAFLVIGGLSLWTLRRAARAKGRLDALTLEDDSS